jgi:antitoxin component YwqK of YwqJK toxin-antitoxin module
MKKIFLFITLTVLFVSCKEEVKQEKKKVEEVAPIIELEEDLVEIKDNIYTEFYPGKKAIKFRGEQDEKGLRNGVWLFYSEKGEELSMTNYEHGIKEGHSMVKYPNGAIHYTGEYKNDKPIGIWKTYDATGKLSSTKDYDKIK